MDPVSMILAFALKNPQATANTLNEVDRPGQVDATQLNSSLIDFARQTLKCYHKTARFVDADAVGGPWQNQAKYGAKASVLLSIKFQGGFTGTPYEMVVAAMVKEGAYRTAVLRDSAIIPYNDKCALEEWVQAN
jgi:hypothetical protein